MDLNTLRGLSTILVMIAFAGVCWWAFSPRRKQRFEDDANLPFADEPSSTIQRDDSKTAPTEAQDSQSAIAQPDDGEKRQEKQQ
ncbi:cbb3-type cytochrome oxidase subunit 3 [Marinibactrum halimedae]|uniref:Cbb3-type cytochrome c oxidase subunit 3 n=1 Tax=Marinibactrum halimedae TaxID=1444977 RepID=A0AA37T5Y9_9GAMM|nr:cbb3-type cytochrome c oxidase subunit 3 [Marinibactrum halimedae]MCD9457916.1 cbb3-type cytochrome c oxidase subunit 3 [Marinibactrum halimedae]GLS26259.1 hypothetical protein GCM10007877_19740 [Marinibactrum halimedae]